MNYLIYRIQLNKMNFYRLHIHTKSEYIYSRVTEILSVSPSFYRQNEINTLWIYAIDERDEDDYIDYINIFLNLLTPNFLKLEELGIQRSDISIWRIYEYEHQCSMEITPQIMKRLGDAGITLCIDCYQK